MDYIGDIEEEPHRRNLADMERRYADVISAADVVPIWRARRAGDGADDRAGGITAR